MSRSDEFKALAEKIKKGGAPKYHQANGAAGKLFCRERIALLCDDGGRDFVEDGLYANAAAADLPADGVVTGIGRVHGRPVALMLGPTAQLLLPPPVSSPVVMAESNAVIAGFRANRPAAWRSAQRARS